MTSRWSRRAHRFTRALGWVVGLGLIGLAVIAALAQVLLPAMARHPQWVAAQLSARLHRPVSFDAMQGQWTPAGPRFALRNVRVGGATPEQAPLRFPAVDVTLDFGGWLLPSRHLLNLHVRGLQLDVTRAADGAWSVRGLGGTDGPASTPGSLGRLSLDLWLDDVRIDLADAASGHRLALRATQLRAWLGSGEIRLGARLRREGAEGVLTAAARLRDDGRQGRAWLAGDGLDLEALLGDAPLGGYVPRAGHGQLATWLDWQDGRLSRVVLSADVTDVSLQTPAGQRVDVASLRGVAQARRLGQGWRLAWGGADGSALVAALERGADDAPQLAVAARRLQLAPLVPWLALAPGMPDGLAHWLGEGRPHGQIAEAQLQWRRGQGLVRLDATLAGVGIDAVGRLPGIDRLDGTLRGDAAALALELPAQATVLRFPDVFRQPFALSRLAGTVAVWQDADGTHLGTDPLEVTGAGFAGQARGEVLLPRDGGRPLLDLYAHVDHAEVTAAKLFLTRGMSPRTRDWLDRGLVGGTVEGGDALVRGSLADWPFVNNAGRFEAQARIHDLTLDYGEGWPRAEQIDAVASFVDNGMLVQVSGGQSMGVAVERAVALIPDFGQAALDLNVSGKGRGADLLGFVSHSPIARHQADTLAKLALGGSAAFDFHLLLPFQPGATMQLNGSAQLDDANLRATDWGLALDGLTGPLQFDAQGLSAGPLQGVFRGQPSILQMRLAGATGDPDNTLSASLDGRFTLAELAQDQPAIAWLGPASEGRGTFRIGLDILRDGANAPWRTRLSVDSPLQDIALKLPAPLDKPAAATLPLHVELGLPTAAADLRIGLGDLLRARFRLPGAQGEPLAGALALGRTMPDASALPSSGLRVLGRGEQLDVSGWIQHVVGGQGGAGAPTLAGIDVSAAHALLFGNDFGDLRMQVKPGADGLAIDVDGASLAGHFDVPTAELARRGITARLKRLYWPRAEAPPPPADGPNAPPAAPADTGPTPEQAARTGVNPASLPPFHLLVDELRLGKARLGQARLESWPTARGMHIDQLRALSPRVQITAAGDWTGDAQASQTHLAIDFSAEDIGKMLDALGFDGLFNGGKTRAHLDGTWPGSPSAITLANLQGQLEVHVTDGRIPEADSPGVGRLLGLVSLTELPRRLTLDFGDVFGKGLAFDSIDGRFAFADSMATTDNLRIKGPAAEITVSGRTGLRTRVYDQQLLVVPHVGNSLPVVGAVVAGPVGAAAGLAVQGLLGKGLNKAASARYAITGSWDDPKITLLEKRVPPPPPPPAAASTGAAGTAPAASSTVAPVPAPAGSSAPALEPAGTPPY